MIRVTKTLTIYLTVFLSTYSVANAFAKDENVIRWAGCGITKKAFMKELAVSYERQTGTKVILTGGGATKGMRDAATLKVDIGGSCRMNLPEVNKSELHANLHPVAWDALAIIVNKNNPINNLTTEQVKAIYRGKISNWQQVGGPNKKIQLYVRKGKLSGVGYAIRQYIFQDADIDFVSSNIVKSSGPLEKAVERKKWALGITGISSARKRSVKILNFDSKSPTYENVSNGSYGLYRPLYLVTSATPSQKVKNFITFANSDEGRQIIRNNGTVPYQDALNLMSKLIIYGFGLN